MLALEKCKKKKILNSVKKHFTSSLFKNSAFPVTEFLHISGKNTWTWLHSTDIMNMNGIHILADIVHREKSKHMVVWILMKKSKGSVLQDPN